MLDVLVVGAGPAGSIAAATLARAGVRVRLVDRAQFPRPKLCGDSLNPGALSLLRRAGLSIREVEAVRIPGMLVTGLAQPLGGAVGRHRATSVEGRYPDGLYGLVLSRSRLDAMLVEHAVAAGAQFDAGVTVTGARVAEHRGAPVVTGVRVATRSGSADLNAPVVLAADGRCSRLAFGLGVLRHASRPRRWAVGGSLHGVIPPATGEMHIRRHGYIGLAPLPGGAVNACVVLEGAPGALRDPASFLLNVLRADPLLRERLIRAELVAKPMVLGPLAVEPTGVEVAGLLTAGDAAGFIDPVTGDGLRFAIQGAELAAAAAVRALECGWPEAQAALRRDRARAFSAKWRTNRAIRRLIGSPRGVRAAAVAAALAPGLVRAVIAQAGDVGLARRLARAGAPVADAMPAAW